MKSFRLIIAFIISEINVLVTRFHDYLLSKTDNRLDSVFHRINLYRRAKLYNDSTRLNLKALDALEESFKYLTRLNARTKTSRDTRILYLKTFRAVLRHAKELDQIDQAISNYHFWRFLFNMG